MQPVAYIPVPDFISDTKNLDTARKMLVSRVKGLNNLGVSVMGMVCNTGHILYQELSHVSGNKLISMIDVVAREANERNYKKVLVLATPTTIRLNLYKNALDKYGISSFYLGKIEQTKQEKIIREVISGEITEKQSHYLAKVTRKFVEQNYLDGVILGCTELPLVFPKNIFSNVIDSMDVLASNLLTKYYGVFKERGEEL